MMTGKERISNIFKRKPVDRIGVYEHFWDDTKIKWENEGIVEKGQFFSQRFNHDMELAWVFEVMANHKFEPVILEETEDTVLKLNGNGAKLRYHKKHNATPEHVGYTVNDCDSYKEHIKPLLTPQEDRIDGQLYLRTKEMCEKENKFFMWSGVAPFECMQHMCGHENMLFGMAMDPDWVSQMAMDYANLTIALFEILFSKFGKPDGLYYYEDMGYKLTPFMSPAMYKEIIFPSHKRLMDFAKSQNLPVMMHSCGFIEPLLPDLLATGLDALDVMENKAGMNPIRIFKNYGDKLSLMGGIDIRTLYTNDKKIIDAELEEKIPILKLNYGYILHSDHSIPVNVTPETYEYFMQKGLELGTY